MEFDLSQLKLSNYDIKRGLVLPKKISKEIAELIGAIIGDGCIRYKPEMNQYYLEIVGNKDEEMQYFNYLKNILKKQFNLDAHIKTRERGLRLKVYSKLFIEFLINGLNMPSNKEKGQNIIIPKQIIENSELLRYCLRGIMDTDGSLFLSNKSHRQDYPTIEISTTSKKLALQLKEILSNKFRTGFRAYQPNGFLTIYRLSLNGEEMIDKWFNEIGFSNQRANRAGLFRIGLKI